jgi:subtilisin family serine protease
MKVIIIYVFFIVLAFVPSAAARLGTDRRLLKAPKGKSIPNQYIVVLNESVRRLHQSTHEEVRGRANELVKHANKKAALDHDNENTFDEANGNSTILEVYDAALKGFAVSNLPWAAVEDMLTNADVKYIQEDEEITLDSVQSPTPSWGLDRLDENPHDNLYSYDFTGSSVVAFVIDSGVRTTHIDFGGRASVGFDAVKENVQDGSGHGTHVGKFYFRSVLLIYPHGSYHLGD